MQFVGVRDLATWMLDLCERDAGRTFNDCSPAGQWTKGGGSGCVELAEVVRDLVARTEPGFTPLYEWSDTIEHKMATVTRAMYGVHAVDYTARARRDLEQLKKAGLDKLPICIAKTQQSLSDNPALLGRPKEFLVTVREIQLAAEAGFIIPITGEILRMPGLPKVPMSSRFDLSNGGEVMISKP